MIIHSRRPTENYTVLSNAVIRDDHLSYRARGVLMYLLSQPGDWETSSERIAAAGKEGRDAIRTALRELIDVGYVTRESEQTAAGHWVMHYTVRDTPWMRSPVDKWGAPVNNPVDNSSTGDWKSGAG